MRPVGVFLVFAAGCSAAGGQLGGVSTHQVATLVARSQALTVSEDHPLAIRLSADTAGETSDPLEFQVVVDPLSGELTGDAPDLVYTPDTDFHGSDHLGFHVRRGDLESDGRIDLDVLPVADAPTGDDGTALTAEDTPVEASLHAADPEGDALTWALVAAPEHLSVELDPTTGHVLLTPNADWNGTESVVWSASDGLFSTGLHYLAVTVVPENDPPVAVGWHFHGWEDQPFAGVVTATDVDGNQGLVFELVGQPYNGTVVLNPTDGTFVFTPTPDLAGSGSFDFAVRDGSATSLQAQAWIEIQSVLDPPAVAPLALSGPEDGVLLGQIAATDLEGGPLHYRAVTQPAHGNAAVNWSSGRIEWTPSPDYSGVDSMIVEVSDKPMATLATVTATVNPVNDAPVVLPDAVTTAVGLPVQAAFAASDPEGDPLTFAVVSSPSNGSVAAVGAQWLYTPNPAFIGLDAFAFTASDGTATSARAVVTVDVRGAGTSPSADDLQIILVGTQEFVVQLTGTDPEGDPLAFSLLALPPDAAVWLDGATLHLVARPSGLALLPEEAAFEVRDPGGASDDGVISIVFDSDADGMADGDELDLGLDPTDPDTDSDGVDDGAELVQGTSPADADTDGDGLNDGKELFLGTDPLVADTDADGLDDGSEHDLGSDPLVADSDGDGDGLFDSLESGTFGTDPADPDTDGDGLVDGDEVWTERTDPLDADTDGDTVPDGAEVVLYGSDPTADETSACTGGWSAEQLDTIPNQTGLEAGDLDGDGDLDLVAASLTDTVRWYRNDAGAFAAGTTIGTPNGPAVATPADLDGDGDLDVLVAEYDGNTVAWYPNLGGGGFAAKAVIASNVAANYWVGPIDLDSDGDLDVLSTSYTSGTIGWSENLGGGAFAARVVLQSQVAPGAALLADLDGDGDVDLVVSTYLSPYPLDVYERIGSSFAAGVTIASPVRVHDLAAGDLDGDGYPELLVAGYNAKDLWWYGNLGGLAFGPEQVLDSDTDTLAVRAADLDGDGDLDVAGASYSGSSVVTYENLGGASFGPRTVIAAESSLTEVLAADVDGDGSTDLAVAGGGVWLHRNLSVTNPDADGLSDAAEECITRTDPSLDDTDGGGTSDLDELLALTDPLDPADDIP